MRLMAPIVSAILIATPAFAQDTASRETRPTTDHVTRAQFTTGVANREPVDQITSLNSNIRQIYFYTELTGLEGQTIAHKWEYAGEVKAAVTFDVNAPRWRVWSTKLLDPSWTGEWTVSVIDASGSILAQGTFTYENAGE